MSSRRAVSFVIGLAVLFSLLPLGTNRALASVETGSNNCFGTGAGGTGGGQCTAGTNNSFFGANAGFSNTANDNSFFGLAAGNFNTTGNANSFFGLAAGGLNTTGASNSFFGRFAGGNNTTGASNSFFGRDAGLANTTGAFNSFFGDNAGSNNTSGGGNSFFGQGAGFSNSTGLSNSFFGLGAGANNTTGASNSFFGLGSGVINTTGASNSFFGQDAGRNNTTADDNSFFGRDAGRANTTGASNSFFGRSAGFSNTTGGGNAFFGEGAGLFNTTGASNTFVGENAGFTNSTGADNAFLGRSAGLSNTTGNRNVFVGTGAGRDTSTACCNTFLGDVAGLTNTTGAGNVAVGRFAASFNTTGSDSTFLGTNAGSSNTIETGNTFVGSNANGGPGITNATALGRQAKASQSNSLVLGSIDGVNSATDSVNVGIGTDTPDHPLEVTKVTPGGVVASVNQGALLVNRTDGNAANIRFANLNRNYLFQNNPVNEVFSIRDETAGNSPLTINPDAGSNLLVLKSGQWGLGVGSPAAGRAIDTNTGGFLSTAGVWTDASSKALKSNIEDLSTEDAVAVLRALQPKSFEYKKAPGDLHLGFLAEDVPELVATAGRKGLSPMDLVTVAIRVLQAKDAENATQSALISDLQDQIDNINKALQPR